jgi:glutamate-1-semialdehyde 2,1-aminomutase
MTTHVSPDLQANDVAYQAIRGVVAGGVSSNMRARGFSRPLVVQRASGARVWDVAGRELIDVNMGYGPHLFGYADPGMAADLAAQYASGGMTGLPHYLDSVAAGLIAELVPSIEQVRFANSGTEAIASALRLARAVTGRSLVLTFQGHYHGWSEAVLRAPAAADQGTLRPVPGAPGMIPGALADVLQVRWNDAGQLRRAFADNAGRLAAVIVEPICANSGVVPPAPGFLEQIRELSLREGALLIFDEVITGFRVSHGGAQQVYGITPDLTIVSKVLGGGFPIAAFGGSRQVMAPLARLEAFHAGVYAGNHAAMRAAVTMLTRIRAATDVYDKLDELGGYAQERVQEAFDVAGCPVWIERAGSVMSVAVRDESVPATVRDGADTPAIDVAAHAELQRACQEGGVYFHPNPLEPWFLSTAHSRADIDAVAEVIGDALRRTGRRALAAQAADRG